MHFKFTQLEKCENGAVSVLASGVLGVLWTPGPGVEDPWKSEHF